MLSCPLRSQDDVGLPPRNLPQPWNIFCSQSDAIMALLSLLLNGPEILKFPSESDGTRPDLMDVTRPCRNGLWPATEYWNGGQARPPLEDTRKKA